MTLIVFGFGPHKCRSLRGDELHADGHWHADWLADLGELAAGLIDLEHRDVVGALIAGDDIRPGRIDAKIAGCAAERFLMAGCGQLARFFINREDRQAVVSAIRAIEEFA